MTPETAAKIYRSMPKPQQDEAKRLIGMGRDRVEVVKNLHGQDIARQGVEAEDEATFEPTTGERVASSAMGAAEQVSPSPGALMATGLIGNPAGPVLGGALMAARHFAGSDQAAEEARAQDPVGFRGGEMLGMVPDAVAGVAGAAKALPAMVRAAPGAGRDIMASLKGRLAGAGDIAKGAAGGFARGAEQGGLTGAAVGAVKGGARAAFPKPLDLTADMVKKAPVAKDAPVATLAEDELQAMLGNLRGTPRATPSAAPKADPSDIHNPPVAGETDAARSARIDDLVETLRKDITDPGKIMVGTRGSRADAAAMEGTVSGGKGRGMPAPSPAAPVDDIRAMMPKPLPITPPPEARSAAQEFATAKWDRAGSPAKVKPGAKEAGAKLTDDIGVPKTTAEAIAEAQAFKDAGMSFYDLRNRVGPNAARAVFPESFGINKGR